MDTNQRRALLVAASFALLPATASGASSDDTEIVTLKKELAETKQQLSTTQDTLTRVVRRLDELESNQAAATPPAGGLPKLLPVNADNPGISFVVDTLAQIDGETGWDFSLRSGELFMSAPIDPFLRGWATINGSSEEGFDIEEAAVVTTSLPYNLTLKGGRFFADVGRLPHWHDEALPFTDRPPSIDRLIGGEAQAECIELTWLAPTSHYISVTTGIYDTIGAERNKELRDAGFDGHRSFDELTWLIHPATYFDLTDTLNVELGATFATVAQHGQRYLYGIDVTLRHQPGTSNFYQGFTLGTEWFWNRERFDDVEIASDPDAGDAILGDRLFNRNGGYAYIEGFFGRRYSIGLRGDYSEAPFGPANVQRTYSAFATWYPSEFHRLRFQLDQIDEDEGGSDTRFSVQWTAFMGSHSHGFTTR